MLQNYSQLVDRIAKTSGLTIDEIDRRVEAKRAKLSGLISKEGAAQIVAAELGISFDKQLFKINELLSGMKRVNVIGKIIRMFPVRSFSKNNRTGKIASFIFADETSNIRTVLWDTNHISLIESEKIKQEDNVEITNAIIRNTELHLTGFSQIKISEKDVGSVIREIQYSEKQISDFRQGQNIKARAIVVQIFEPRFFEVCPECRKKVMDSETGKTCEAHGTVAAEKRALLNMVLDDGTGNIRAVLFSEQLKEIGLSLEQLQKTETFLQKREELLGSESFFSGSVRKNKIFNNLEIFVNGVEKIDVSKVIEVLEKNE